MLKKIATWTLTAPVLLLAAMPAAQANIIQDILCQWFGWCAPPSGGGGPGGGGGPVSVSEPEMLALFSTSLIVTALVALHKRRK